MRKSLVAFFSLIAFVPGVFAQGGGVQTASVTLTSAQVQHLHASPVQLVASPGAGQFVDVISVAYQYRAGSTPYALSNGGNFVVGPAAIFPTSATGFIDQTSNAVAVAGKSTETVYQSVVENQAITVSNDNGTEWANGDGTVTVTISYRVVALQ
jgi:hypothetical protein